MSFYHFIFDTAVILRLSSLISVCMHILSPFRFRVLHILKLSYQHSETLPRNAFATHEDRNHYIRCRVAPSLWRQDCGTKLDECQEAINARFVMGVRTAESAYICTGAAISRKGLYSISTI